MNQNQPSLRYAVLHHSGIEESHFDLLIETHPGSDLATWRSPNWPLEEATELTRLKDHRRIYLDYQGDLSGHRGNVQRVAEGNCTVQISENAVWKVQLDSTPMTLTKINGDRWLADCA